MSDLTNHLLSMPQVLKAGIENLHYDFRYDAQTKQIVVSYEFTCGIPTISGTTTVDYEIPDEGQAARLTRRALKIFSARLGDAIERAIRQLASQSLYEAGVDFTDTGTEMASSLSADFRREVADELGVRRGPHKGKRKTDRSARTAFEKRVGLVVAQLKRANSKPTKTAVAKALFHRNSNPIRELNRKLKAFGLTFSELMESEGRSTVNNIV
jgi:hypothetical protein